MGLALYTPVKRPGTGLVSTYIEYIGAREPNNVYAIRGSRPDSPCQASLKIGAACLLLIHGIDREADMALRTVRDTMRTYVEEKGRTSSLGPTAAQLGLVAIMLLERDDPEAAKRFQIDSHAESIVDLRRLRPILRRHKNAAPAGQLTEQALSGLTTRYAGPGTLAVQALFHHDQGNRRIDNTDFVIVDSGDRDRPPAARRGQLKLDCQGFCGDKNGSIIGNKVRAEYMEDIVIISGHCDLLDPASGHSMSGLAKRLILEAGGSATPGQIEILDEATLHVLQTIIDPEEWRMGTHPMAKSLAYSYRQ